VDLFGLFKDDKTPDTPILVRTRFKPYALKAMAESDTDLIIEITNNSKKEVLLSLTVSVPYGIGFDNLAMQHSKEVRLGTLTANETKEIVYRIQGNTASRAGIYKVRLTVMTHYRNYDLIENKVSKAIDLRVGG